MHFFIDNIQNEPVNEHDMEIEEEDVVMHNSLEEEGQNQGLLNERGGGDVEYDAVQDEDVQEGVHEGVEDEEVQEGVQEGVEHEEVQEAEEGEDDEDDEEDEEDEVLADETYKSIHEKLVYQWLSTEIDHRTSKIAANEFWNLGNKYFHKLYQAKEREGISRKTPQFLHTRRKIYDEKVPRVSMEVAYQNKVTGEITILKDIESTPTSRFPPDEFTKLYESASVEVIKKISLYYSCF